MKDKNTAAAQTYLREKCGAYRGHPEWRALEQAFLAGAESKSTDQCLRQIQEPPTKTEALAHYSQQAILAMGEAGTAAVTVPDGWKLVPLVPTTEMLESAGAIDRDGTPATYKTLYMAMVGAALNAPLAATPAAAAPVVLAELDDRAEFENDWLRRHYPLPMNTRMRDDLRYGDHIIQGQFEAWNAGRALLAGVSAPAALEEQSLTDDDAADLFLETTCEFWGVIAPCGEGVLFRKEADARWTQTGEGAGSDGFGVPTIGESFRECYEDKELELVRVHIAAAKEGAQQQ